MTRLKLISLVILTGLISCNEKQNETTNHYSALEILENNSTPTVDILKYTLIVESDDERSNDAKEILEVKRKWPLAMQSQNPLEFDSILSKKFTFKGSDAFFNREEYIKNRTTPDDWKITFVKYDNVTLQFFDNTAVLSYKNHIRNENVVTKEIEIEHISWVDIYIKENKKWKLGAAHSIDYRLDSLSTDKSHADNPLK